MARKESSFDIDGIEYKVKYEESIVRILKNSGEDFIVLPQDLIFYINEDISHNTYEKMDKALNEDGLEELEIE